jgi:glycosyltransferase involved in cell wall biosynthesis
VALPILKSNIAASGLSTCFNAMALGKCVIGTEGPGFTDIFTDEVLTVPAGDPAALAAMIRKAWENDALREETAMRGHQYVRKAGGRDDLYRRIIDAVGEWRAKVSDGTV